MKKQNRKPMNFDPVFMKELKHFSVDLGIPMTKVVKQLVRDGMKKYYGEKNDDKTN